MSLQFGAGEDAVRKGAQAALRDLSKASLRSRAEMDEAAAKMKHVRQNAKDISLSQAAEKHAHALGHAMSIQSVRALIDQRANDWRLMGLNWHPPHLILPQLKPRGPYPGLRNLGNTCFLNAILQCFAHVAPLRKALEDTPPDGSLALHVSVHGFIHAYTRQDFGVLSPVETVKDFFLSWQVGIPGDQQDAVEAANHLLTQCHLGACVNSQHAVYGDGIITRALPDGFSSQSTCALHDLLQHALCGEDAPRRCPDVLVVAFNSMYEEAQHHWWVDLKLTDLCSKPIERKRSSSTATAVGRTRG